MKCYKKLITLGLSCLFFLPSALANSQFCVAASENITVCIQAETREAAINLLATNLQSEGVMQSLYETALMALENKNITDDNQQLMLINREQVDCIGVVPMKCLQVKYALDQPEWENFYGDIQGFNFEEGNHYLLRVKKTMIENPPADAPSIRYELIEIMDKI